jgi:ketosteroid isomerase-like protein
MENLRLSYVSFFGNSYLQLKCESYFLSADGSSAALLGTYTDFTESGHTATVPLAEILKLRDGKIIRLDEYYDDVGFQ